MTPERTFALIVGVEKYAASGMRLPGAAQDALRVAGWLTGPGGVPAANVRLFVSPLESTSLDWSCVPELSHHEGHCRAATHDAISDALLMDLAQCDGDLLWFYWAGHGFQYRESGMLLPYSNAKDRNLAHLDLDSMLRSWRSTTVPRGRFKRQVVIVDACQVKISSGSALGVGNYGHPIGEGPPGRRDQFVLYAAREGQAAKNQAELMSGQFTQVLLEQIEAKPIEEAVAELVDIARAVQDRFRELSAEGKAWQEPTFAVHRSWDGSPVFDDIWPLDLCAPQLDQQAWDELDELFKEERGLLAHTFDAYCWAFEVTGSAVPPETGAKWEQILEVLRDLDERRGSQADMPLVLPFIRFLASRAWPDDLELAATLGEWVERTRSRLGAGVLQPPPPKRVTHCSLYARIEESTRQLGSYYVDMWLNDGERKYTHLEDVDGGPFSTAELREHVIAQLASQSRRSGGARVDRVEFHISLAMLDGSQHPGLNFEAWPVPYGKSGKSIALGCICEVVVRFSEDRTWPEDDWWRAKWNWLQVHGGKHPEAVRTLTRDDAISEVTGQFEEEGPPVCVLTESADPAEALVELVGAGIPIAVWCRGDTARTDGDCLDIAALLADSDQAGAPLDVHAIPGKVRKLRKAAAAALHPLALMWDDPTRLPEITPLSC